MGYRTYFAVVNKEETEPFRSFGPNYFCVEDEYESHRAFSQLVSERFGRREEFCITGLNIDVSKAEPFFKNPETQEMCEHYHPYIADSGLILAAIEEMRKFVLNYYEEAQKNGTCEAVVANKIDTWKAPYRITPYNISPKTTNIVTVMQTEYEIFELVRIYKSIDWKKEYVIYYGW